ncbi:hypothetical protein GCM10017744_098280 [Streptomyces antimycoticus]
MSSSSQSEQIVEALRASLKDNARLKHEYDKAVAATSAPIAIVGMACRLPGGVSTRRSCGSWCPPAATASPAFR